MCVKTQAIKAIRFLMGISRLRLRLVHVKYFLENIYFLECYFTERKGKYFQVFGCIMKIFLENNFICLVTF